MIDPVILEHFRTLKEREELDAVLPEILTGMGLEVLSRADIGVRQYGADVAAVGKDDDGKRKLFLFSVKRGDLTRGEWNGRSDQALQPSLDEIRYVYHRSVAPEHKKLPVVIVAVLGGIVPQKVAPLVHGYMETMEQQNPGFVYRLWTGDTLTRRLLEGVLREEIFPGERRALLRKTAALLEEPEQALRHYTTLLRDVLGDDSASEEERVRAMVVATRVVFSWGREVGNLEVPYQASEMLLLRAWALLYPRIEHDTSRKQVPSHVYFAVVQLYLEVWRSFLGDKILPHAGKMHALSFAVGAINPLDINLALCNLVGRVALGGLLQLWLLPGAPDLPGLIEGSDNPAHDIARALAQLVQANPTVHAPMLDGHSTDLGLGLLLLCCFEDTREVARYWNRQAARAFMIAVTVPQNGPRLPSIDTNYETLLRPIEDPTPQELSKATAASTLLPLYALCARVLADTELLAELDTFQKDHLAHCNAQGWVPNARCDDKMWQGERLHGSALPNLEIGEAGEKLVASLRLECEENTAWAKLSAIKLGHWALVAIACRQTRVPIPPQMWLGLLDGNRVSFSKNDRLSFNQFCRPVLGAVQRNLRTLRSSTSPLAIWSV